MADRCRLVFVSFCDPQKRLEKLWIEEWMKKYPGSTLLLDPKKDLYEAWSLSSSFAAAWGMKNSLYYAKAFFMRGQTNVALKGESTQLGADFAIEAKTGKVALCHYCRDPTDRVLVEEIVDAVKKLTQ